MRSFSLRLGSLETAWRSSALPCSNVNLWFEISSSLMDVMEERVWERISVDAMVGLCCDVDERLWCSLLMEEVLWYRAVVDERAM